MKTYVLVCRPYADFAEASTLVLGVHAKKETAETQRKFEETYGPLRWGFAGHVSIEEHEVIGV